MFSRLSNSWELVKASYAVLRADKELILFPILSLFASAAVIVAFAVPMLLAGAFDSLVEEGGGIGVATYVVAFLFYLVMYFIGIFANTALVGAALIRLRGGDPTVRDGFRIAFDHVGQIFGYALIAATVGMVLRALRERGLAGQLIAWLGSMAWNLVTFLVVPVLVVENLGPIEAIKRSGSLLKRTWGEQIVGNFSIGLVFGLLTLGAVLVIGLPVLLLTIATGSAVLIVLGVGVIILLIVGIGLLGSALNGIYVAALYRYATEGATAPVTAGAVYFPPELVQGAFRHK